GSLLIIEDFDESFFIERLKKIQGYQLNLLELGIYDKVINRFKTLIAQAKLLSETYDIYVTNPPYLGRKYQTMTTKEYLGKNYDDVKNDLFSSFISSSFRLTKEKGYIGFMTPQVWMFISSYEKLRKNIINNSNISSLIQLEYSGFEAAIVAICTFTFRNILNLSSNNLTVEYIKLTDFYGPKNQPIKVKEAVENKVNYRYTFNQNNYSKIPGSPIAYWVSESVIEVFELGTPTGSLLDASVGLFTTNNEKFLRIWWEVEYTDITFNAESVKDAISKEAQWVTYNKGGKKSDFYGNNDYIIDFSDGGKPISEYRKSKGQSYSLPGKDNYFKESITWSLITASGFSMRYREAGSI